MGSADFTSPPPAPKPNKKRNIQFLNDDTITHSPPIELVERRLQFTDDDHTPSPIRRRLQLIDEIIELGEMRLELFRLINNTQQAMDAERKRKVAILMSYR